MPESTPDPAAYEAQQTNGGSDSTHLRVDGVSKSFGAVHALKDVTFEVTRGEVVGIVGDNGAGKTTLIRCMAGIHKPDRGSIDVGTATFNALSPSAAHELGIEVVHQTLGLVDGLDIVANLFLNRELRSRNPVARKLGVLDRRRMQGDARQALEEFGLAITNLRRPVGELSGGQRQMLAIIRAVQRRPNFVLMDEPTAALGVVQSQHVQELVLQLRERDIGVIVVSHRMDQVLQITDRIVVLRHGSKVADLVTRDTDVDEVVGHITGAREPRFDGPTDREET